MAVMVLLSRIDTDQKGGWVQGVSPGPRNAGHGSVGLSRVIPFESQSGECS